MDGSITGNGRGTTAAGGILTTAMTPTVLCVSGSAKMATSASRSLVDAGAALIRPHVSVTVLDLATQPLPHYAGYLPQDHPDESVRELKGLVEQADALVLGIPCYWGMPAGTLINFIDLVCGPTYDLERPDTAFTGTGIGVLLVGADDTSAEQAIGPVTTMVKALGASVVGEPLLVANPRGGLKPNLTQELNRLFLTVAQHAVRARIARSRDDH